MQVPINPDKIQVEPNTIIAIRGTPNIGKSTFICKNLKEFQVVSGDDILNEIYRREEKKLLEFEKKGNFAKIAQMRDNMIKESNYTTIQRLQALGKKGKTVVYDSLLWKNSAAQVFFYNVAPYYSHTISICIVGMPSEVLSRPLKKVKMIGSRYYTTKELCMFISEYFNLIESGEIHSGFEKSCIIESNKRIMVEKVNQKEDSTKTI